MYVQHVLRWGASWFGTHTFWRFGKKVNLSRMIIFFDDITRTYYPWLWLTNLFRHNLLLQTYNYPYSRWWQVTCQPIRYTLALNLKPHIVVYRIQELNLRPDDDTIFGKIILYVVIFYKQIIRYIVFFYKKNTNHTT